MLWIVVAALAAVSPVVLAALLPSIVAARQDRILKRAADDGEAGR